MTYHWLRSPRGWRKRSTYRYRLFCTRKKRWKRTGPLAFSSIHRIAKPFGVLHACLAAEARAVYRAQNNNDLPFTGGSVVIKQVTLNDVLDLIPRANGGRCLSDANDLQTDASYYDTSYRNEFDQEEFSAEYANREFEVSQTIERRLGNSVCGRYVVCAERLINVPQLRKKYIIYSYIENSNNLMRVLTLRTYNIMRELSERVRQSRVNTSRSVTRVDDLYQQYERGFDQLPPRIAAFYRRQLIEFGQPYLYVSAIGIQVAMDLAIGLLRLHQRNIFHRDIKPRNVLTVLQSIRDRSFDVRAPKAGALLIDFGVACADPSPFDQLSDERRERIVRCNSGFVGTSLYTDPLFDYIDVLSQRSHENSADFEEIDASGSESVESVLLTEREAKFDVYALGKVYQRLFDPSSVDINGQQRFPVVQDTDYMPRGMLPLIQDMTGENNYRPSRANGGRLTQNEIDARLANYRTRPTAGEVARRLQVIANNFLESDAVAINLLDLPN